MEPYAPVKMHGEDNMDTAWWHVLEKNRGSRPRSVLLADGARPDVAGRLTDLVRLPDVAVSANDFWMPCGKPVCTRKEWNKKPAVEARLDRDVGFLPSSARQALSHWWLKVPRGANTPNWDLVSTCTIEGSDGLVLVEAKAHANELSVAGKSTPRSENGWKNHQRIGSAIEQAKAGFRRDAGGSWALARDSHYQLSNRFAWSWKLTSLGVPVVLVYLGFLNAEEMATDGMPFRSEGDWKRAIKDHARGVVDDTCWGRRLLLNGKPFRALIRVIEVPFNSRIK